MRYCPNCGHGPRHQPVKVWPYKCLACGTEHFSSPKPVVALILHAWATKPSEGDWSRPGIVAIRRGIEPYKGELAFPGGYIDHAEDWRLAAAREAYEELGVVLDPRQLHLRGEPVVTPTNYLVLFVSYSGDVLITEDFKLSPREVQEVRILTREDQDDATVTLGVPSHQTLWKSLPLI